MEAPARGLPPGDHEPGFFQRYGAAIIFLAPTLVLLGVWVVYPTIRTIIRSFYDRGGDEFIGLDNYETLFTDDTLVTAIKNNFLWLLIVPAFVTAIGLVFAVLLERIRFSVAFKVVVFMPMAISLFAAGVIWRLMYEKDPSQGTINAAVAVVKDAVSPSGVLSAAQPSTDALQGRTVGRPRAGEAARAGRRRAARADGHPLLGRPRRRGPGGRAGGARRRDHRRGLERLQAGRRHARAKSRRTSSACPASRSNSATTSGGSVLADADGGRTGPSRSRTSRPARTALRSAPTRSRSRTQACRGSARA